MHIAVDHAHCGDKYQCFKSSRVNPPLWCRLGAPPVVRIGVYPDYACPAVVPAMPLPTYLTTTPLPHPRSIAHTPFTPVSYAYTHPPVPNAMPHPRCRTSVRQPTLHPCAHLLPMPPHFHPVPNSCSPPLPSPQTSDAYPRRIGGGGGASDSTCF